MTTDDFRQAIKLVMDEEKAKGSTHIDINSGKLHRQVGGYPGQNHSMPACCDAMRSLIKDNDEIMSEPAKGKGASLTIRYFL